MIDPTTSWPASGLRPTIRNTCRACVDSPPLERLLDLGLLHLSAFPQDPLALPEFPPVPLTLMVCPLCWLVQLRHTTPFPWLFGREYWYRSGVNETMRAELEDVVWDGIERVGGLKPDDLVLDIGANDGTLLSTYGRRAIRMAFEPSTSLNKYLRPHADLLFADAFPPEAPSVLLDVHKYDGRVKVATAIAMVYDLEDPNRFFTHLADLLAPDGILILQFQDLLQMVEKTAFDCICHEHLEYYSLYSLATLLNHHRLDVVDVMPRTINGGSLRVIVQKRGRPIPRPGAERVLEQIKREYQAGLTNPLIYTEFQKFAHRIQAAKGQVQASIAYVAAQGGSVDLLGASTKGNTLLQVFDLDHRQIRRAIERDPIKIGRYVGQTGIPIVGEPCGRADAADLWLSPIWQFKDALIQREQEYLRQGGAILFPLPAMEVVMPDRRGVIAQAS